MTTYKLVYGREIQPIAFVVPLSTYKLIQALKHRTVTGVSTICKFKNSIKYLKEKAARR